MYLTNFVLSHIFVTHSERSEEWPTGRCHRSVLVWGSQFPAEETAQPLQGNTLYFGYCFWLLQNYRNLAILPLLQTQLIHLYNYYRCRRPRARGSFVACAPQVFARIDSS